MLRVVSIQRSFRCVGRCFAAYRPELLRSQPLTAVESRRTGNILQTAQMHSSGFLRQGQEECEGGVCEIPVRSPSDAKKFQAAKSFVENTLKKYPVVVFSSVNCAFCTKAKEVLAKYSLPKHVYNVIELDEHELFDGIMDYMKQKTGARTLPRVFIGGKCIGGGDDTVRLDDSGELRKQLSNIK